MTDVHRFIRRFRAAVMIFATSGFGWVPCILLSLAFFHLDDYYQYAVNEPSAGTSLGTDYRRVAASLEGASGFGCDPAHYLVISGRDRVYTRGVELSAIRSSMSAVRGREVRVSDVLFRPAVVWIEELGLAPLRSGRELRLRYDEGYTPFAELERTKLKPYCEEQDLRRAREEELLPPLQIAGEIRTMLLRAADRMDEAVAAYEEVRPWLLAFFCAWIAYTLVGLGCAFYVLRLTRLHGELIRASREAADLPPW